MQQWFSRREALAEAVRALLPQYMQASGYGLLLLRRQIQAERDEPESVLIARHGYCSPDLVNLLLTGRAVANCFNGDRQLDGKVYRGIPARSHLGLLTLFEPYTYVDVGSHLKSPHLPIWLVCSESHFTTLFAPSARDGRLALSNALSTFDYTMTGSPTRPIKACGFLLAPCRSTSEESGSRCLCRIVLALAVPVVCSRQACSTAGMLPFSSPTAELVWAIRTAQLRAKAPRSPGAGGASKPAAGQSAEASSLVSPGQANSMHVQLATKLWHGQSPGRRQSGGATDHVPAEEVRSMRQLLFGRDCGPGLPWGAWKQGLFFNTMPGLAFGLVQKQGGPCGVLAAMQAHVLAALWDPVTGMQLHLNEAADGGALRSHHSGALAGRPPWQRDARRQQQQRRPSRPEL
ncbi:hypothetical protein WJX72_010771 [[Myrmecia] bisecta]|uniref:Deubiquitinating enzyme MINDY-3/4 conserved domain-containing protein n=1 Tax=[Myrmecia] bisecta TaxID=41462 RepID=A0AAW1Q4K2_9CHLO